MLDFLLPFFKTFVNAILILFAGYLVAFVLYQILKKNLEKPLGKTWAIFLGGWHGWG